MTEPLWRDLTHQQVWEQVHAGPGPYVSDSAAVAWRNAESALRQIDGDLNAAITKAAGWTGTAADAARSGLTPLGGWTVDATSSAGRAAASLTEHQVQVSWVRANLPEPGPAPAVEPPIALSDPGVDPAVLQDWTVTVGRNTALADQAFHIMDAYAANTTLIQQQAPAWTPPPAVTVSVAGAAPPSGAAVALPKRTFPAGVAPAAASPITAVGAAHHPPGAAQDGNRAGRLPPAAVSTITPTASGPAEASLTGRTSASRDSSAPPVPGPPVGPTQPDGSSVLRGGPDDATLANPGGAGGLATGARGGTGGPGSAGDVDGVLRGLPDGAETATGVLRGTPGGRSGMPMSPFGQGGPGSAVLGGRPAGPSGGLPGGGSVGTGYPGSGPDGAGFGGRPTDAGPGYSASANLGGRSAHTGVGYPGGRADVGTGGLGGHPTDPQGTFRSAAGRPAAEGHPGYLPAAGIGLGHRADTHRTPDYLVDTYAFFADERRLAGPLITPEEPLPLRS